jgi:hypothetical protein
MNAMRRCRALFTLLVIALASAGCGWARGVHWAVGEQEDSRVRWAERWWPERDTQQTASDYNDVQRQRAQAEADFRSRNPSSHP